ncbi:peptide MFS transporter [Brevibacterium luteolum]|uniref:peptide MFS transporter n=1 Tax=Brevibacterium luteolum TaxID=199591 RepID=UPI0021AEF613|nr:oligopeptide:H+ symporter [Brevibacterium luteolum]MCT1830398.1 oligopeptide:H+ symporter [Brevibacterium luteolum]
MTGSSPTDASALSAEDMRNDTRFFGHPLPLMQLFGLEMWERFSYYGMTGILVLYLYFATTDGGIGMDQPTAFAIVGAYGGAVFLATVGGAWLADRVFGAEPVLFWSAVIIMCGHIALGLLPGIGGVALGLILVALGSGGLKATASAIVGTLYTEKDTRREAGFSLFYMGINIGALLGPLVTGWLQKDIGFHIGFGAAAVGMAIGLALYLTGRKNLPASAKVVVNPLPAGARWKFGAGALGVVAAIAALWMTGAMNADNLAMWTTIVCLVAAIAYFTVILRSNEITDVERSRTLSFIPFVLATVAFWSLYQQIFNALTGYSDTQMNRNIFGWEMPISWITLIPAFFVIALAPVFSAIWLKLGDRQPATPVKAGLSLLIIGGAYLLFLPYAHAQNNTVPLLWVVFILALFVAAELLISPIGLSVATRLSPKVFTSQMIALYFLGSGVGTSLSGVFAKYYDADNQVPYWTTLGLASIVAGLLVLMTAKPVIKLMRGVK